MNTILIFAFETGDTDCKYWQEFVIVNSNEVIDYDLLEDSISSYMESNYDEDNEYSDNVKEIMDASGLSWSFVGDIIPESKAIHTFWI